MHIDCHRSTIFACNHKDFICKKLRQTGFAAFELILVLIVIGLLGGVGWWIYNQNKVKQSDTSSTSPFTSSEQDNANQTAKTSTLQIKEWGVQITVDVNDAIYKIQDNLAYLSTSTVEDTAECKEARQTAPEFMYGIARHSNLTDKLYNQPPEAGQSPQTVEDGLKQPDLVKKVGNYYYEYFHGNGIDCAPPTTDYKAAFQSLTIALWAFPA